jgi:hypothetical protein
MRSAAIMADGNDENIVRLKGIRDTPRPPLDPDAAMPGSEDALALEFADQHAAKLRWCNPWGAWLQWDAGAWQLIKTRFVFHLVRVIARKHAALLDDKRLARDVTQAAIERMARNDPRHDTRDDAWDRDQETISTPEER